MIDLEIMKTMLDGANIPYHSEPLEEDENSARRDNPLGGTSLTVGDSFRPYEHVGQPHEGGYIGFFTEIVFDADGHLWAIWAWE